MELPNCSADDKKAEIRPRRFRSVVKLSFLGGQGGGMRALRILIIPFIAALLAIATASLAQAPNAPFRPTAVLNRLPPTVATPYLSNSLTHYSEVEDGDDNTEGIDIGSLEDLAWQKGSFRLVPYGFFATDMIYATQRTNIGAYTTYVFSREDQDEDAFTIDTRRSRLGLEITGPRVVRLGDAESRGRFEIDFFGEFISENRASVLLRQAYWEVKSDEFRLLIGQTWDVIAPLNPDTLNYAIGLFAGNIGFRRTQFRAERYFNVSDTFQATLQGALSQDIVTDFPMDPGVRREPSDWPVVQARAAMTFGPRGEDQHPVVFGCSGHIGETGFDFLTVGPPPLNLPPQDDARFRTWSLNADIHVPIGDRFGFQGEFFTGANLSAFLGGIGQGVCPCLRIPIRSTGGWAEVWYDWTPHLHSHVGFGVDDPNDDDALLGRAYNQFIFSNLVFDMSDELTTGIEVTYWKTLYHEERVGQIPPDQLSPSEPGEAIVIEWMVKYAF
jgi:hypothetical protein